MKRASFLLPAVLAACAQPGPTVAPVSEAPSPAPTPAAAARARSSADELFAYLSRLRTLNEASIGAEAARMKRDASEMGRLKAALALSLSPQSDEGDIIELVEPLRRTGADVDVRAMASFLHATATERRRLKQRAASAAGEAREERKVAETQKQRADALQQKLDALTDLEKSLAAREAQR